MRSFLLAAILAIPFLGQTCVPARGHLQTHAELLTLGQAQSPAQPQTEGRQAGDADSQSVENHIITVTRSGEAYAKPDLGILVMSISSTSPIADEAVSQNAQKAQAVESALGGLGIASAGYKITSVAFGQAGAGMPHFPGQSDVTGYTATQYVYVFFEAADLNDVAQLTKKTASVIEALRKAGAAPANAGAQFGPAFPGAPGALIIYTVKDPVPYEHEALQMAVSRARDAAQDLAAGLGVQITGVRNVQSSALGGNVMPRSGPSPLAGLRYRFYSPKSDELEIVANATVEYDFK
jgi:uncharacterized protein YggE